MASLNGRPRTDLVAIVDLGSAAVRFIIARIRPSARYFILVEERVPTRLGSGAPGTLPTRAIARTLRLSIAFSDATRRGAGGPA